MNPGAVLDALTDAIAVLDKEGSAVFANAAWKRLGQLAAVSEEPRFTRGGDSVSAVQEARRLDIDADRAALRDGCCAVLSGALERFDTVLAFDAGKGLGGRRIFAVTVTPYPLEGGPGAVV